MSVSRFPALIILLALVLQPAIAQEPNPPKLEFKKWSGDIVVPDPVAVSLDDEGRAYVTQTQRRKSQDLDIRNNRDWIENDVSFQSVEEKRAFYQERLSPEKSADNTGRVDDMNKDGSHDYRDLMVLSEKIFLLEDKDEDGTADAMQLYADGFATEVTGIAAGVLWHEGEVYSTIAPDVWRMRDTDGDGKVDEREIMATGFGLHIAYAGHDMHGLTVGPDGKIYWSIGDKGISAKSQEGQKFHYPNQGGVMRCNPDGSDFEVFAHGLRNVQEIAFDEFGNLFGVDNDSDQPGEMERFVYIVKDMDAAWRANFQYRGGGYNPWMAEKLWQPSEPGQPAYFIPPICNYKDGPAGFVYNPGTALSPEWRHWFFLTGAPKGDQWAFQAKPDGASFEMINSRSIGKGIPLVGMNFGPDGGLYSVDWGGGYPLNQSGAVWKIDVPKDKQDPLRAEVKELMRKDYTAAEIKELTGLLAHPDQRIRMKAQFELVNREERAALITAAQESELLGRVHAIWGLGQLARSEDREAIDALATLLEDEETEVRAHSLRVLGDLKPESYLPASAKSRIGVLLADDSPRVRFFAALTTGDLALHDNLAGVIRLLEENNGKDLYLRHAGITGLAGLGTAATLVDHPSGEVRLCAAVALRRNGNPDVADFLTDKFEPVASEAALAIHDDFSIPDALPALASALSLKDQVGNEMFVRRAINANLRLGKPENALEVAKYAANGKAPKDLRLNAIDTLATWVTPPNLDRVDGRFRELGKRDAEPIADAIGSEVSGLLASNDDELVEKSLGLAAKLKLELDPEPLLVLLRNENIPGTLRAEALENLNDSEEALEIALKSKSAALRIAGAKHLVSVDPDRALDYLKGQLEGDAPLKEKQAAMAGLAKLETEAADAVIDDWARRLLDIEPGLQLDVIQAAEARDQLVSMAAFVSSKDPGDQLSMFQECLEGGDAAAGKEIFMTHIAAQCIRCHKVEDGKGSIVGPNLKSVAFKGRPFILQSLVEPMKEISKGYGTITVTLKDGTAIASQFRSETDDYIELRDPEGKTQKIKKSDIAERSEVMSVMPPMGFILKKHELRDLVEYLTTLDEPKKK